jgi:capsular polysaccharide biosynthesis protein
MMVDIPMDVASGLYLAGMVDAGRAEIIAEILGNEAYRRSPFMVSDPIDTSLAVYGRCFCDPPVFKYTTQPVNLHRIRSAVLLGTDGVVLQDGATVRDTVHTIMYWLPESLVSEYVHFGGVKLKRDLSGGGRVTDPVFIGFTAAWRNYAHWMQECLPKIVTWLHAKQFGNPKLVVPWAPEGSFQAETLRLLGIGADDMIRVQAEDVLIFDEALVMSELDGFCVSSLVADAGQALARTAGDRESSYAGLGERIYLHRSVEARRLANFDILESVLKYRGFKVVSFEGVPLERQIAIMRESRHVIAGHGAGLINVMFCRQKAGVLEMFNPACVQPEFWSVASVCGHRYGYLVGSHLPTSGHPVPDWNSAYEILPERLDAAIAAMLENSEE